MVGSFFERIYRPPLKLSFKHRKEYGRTVTPPNISDQVKRTLAGEARENLKALKRYTTKMGETVHRTTIAQRL